MSEFAGQIVDKLFSGDKVSVIDTLDSALQSRTYELINQKKIEFAREWGFELDQTGQEEDSEDPENSLDTSDDESDEETTEQEPEDETNL
jgi:hypothetical protein